MRNMQLADAEVMCAYVDASLYQQTGVVLQFVNSNQPDSATIIGGMRLKIKEIRKVPAYLAKYRQRIKMHAIATLQRHFLETQCPAGVTETLCPDDYSISYMVASLSDAGRRLNPSGRNEGPLFYLLYPALVEERYLYLETDGTPSSSHVINVYIHLNEAVRRRTAVLKRHQGEVKKKESAAKALAHKKPRMGALYRNQGGQNQSQILQAAMSTLAAEVRQLRPQAPANPNQKNGPAVAVGMSANNARRLAEDVNNNRNRPHNTNQYPAPPAAAPLIWPPVKPLPEMPDC